MLFFLKCKNCKRTSAIFRLCFFRIFFRHDKKKTLRARKWENIEKPWKITKNSAERCESRFRSASLNHTTSPLNFVSHPISPIGCFGFNSCPWFNYATFSHQTRQHCRLVVRSFQVSILKAYLFNILRTRKELFRSLVSQLSSDGFYCNFEWQRSTQCKIVSFPHQTNKQKMILLMKNQIVQTNKPFFFVRHLHISDSMFGDAYRRKIRHKPEGYLRDTN